jgi:hypothetical protein
MDNTTKYIAAGLLGVAVGGVVMLIVTRAIPNMMSRMMTGMMHNMMTQMQKEGCTPKEM